MSLAVFSLSAFVIVYILVQLISTLSVDVEYQYATVLKTDDYMETTGYLVRNETVLYANEEGVLNYAVKESQKIGSEQLVATVFESSEGVDIQNQIDKIDEKIALLERSTVDTSYLTSDVSKIDASIYSCLVKSKLAVHDNEVYYTPQYKEDLIISFNKRELITKSASDFSEQIQALKQKRNELTATLDKPLSSVYAPKSGYFSTLLDGYESLFSTDVIQGLTVDSYRELIQSKPSEYSDLAVGKIVTDFDWYTLCEVSKKEADEFDVGSEYSISYLYSSGTKICARLDQKITQTDLDHVVLVFLIEEIPREFDYARQQTIQIVKKSFEGISFPKSSLRMIDGEQGVFVISGNSVGFKKVEIIYSGDSYYISAELNSNDENYAKYLNRFDRVITEGKDLYVGKILD